MAANTRSPEEQETLRKASKQLLYEYKMLITTAAMLEAVKGKQRANAPRTNALLESFTIHFRSLLDFFEKKKPSKGKDGKPRDDVLVRHFLRDGKSWTKPDKPAGINMRALRKRVDKEVAHLTYTRLELDPEDNERRWPKEELVDYLKECVRRFRDDTVVDPTLLHEDWQGFTEGSYEEAVKDEAKSPKKRSFAFVSPSGSTPSTSASFTVYQSLTPPMDGDGDQSLGTGAPGGES